MQGTAIWRALVPRPTDWPVEKGMVGFVDLVGGAAGKRQTMVAFTTHDDFVSW